LVLITNACNMAGLHLTWYFVAWISWCGWKCAHISL